MDGATTAWAVVVRIEKDLSMKRTHAAVGSLAFLLQARGERPAPELVSLGVGASYRGHEGFLALWEEWDSSWAGHPNGNPRS